MNNTHHASVRLNGDSDNPLPLAGAIICCTSVPEEKRTQIAEHVEQMGGIHRYDLTLDVTHLVVGDYNTPKYRYVAKGRPDVKPMTVEWIEAVRGLWINDAEIDIEALEKEHTLPIFNGLKFSMTGCDNPDDRAHIADQVRSNGAVYEGDLTKQITHLISFRTEGAKYKAAKAWNIRIISIEWLRDSLERGMILDEELYDPVLPEAERGKEAWDKTKPKRTSLGKRSRDDSVSGLEGAKRKLRRTASTKLNSQSEQLWGDIVGGGNVTEVSRSGVWEVQDGTLQRGKKVQQKEEKVAKLKPSLSSLDQKPIVEGIFSRCRFYFHGFPQKKVDILCGHLAPKGAEVVSSLEELCSLSETCILRHQFMIVPHDLPVSKHPDVPQTEPPIQKVTDWWVERCLHHKNFIDPSDHVVGRPFPVFPIEGFPGMTICSSAFSGIDLLHFKRSVELIGAKYSEDMTPQCSVLVTKSSQGLRKDKYEHAVEWNVPIVAAEWLWRCIESGSRMEPKSYRYRSRKISEPLPKLKEVQPAIVKEVRVEDEAASETSPSPRFDTSAFFTADDGDKVKDESESYTIPREIDASDDTTQDPSTESAPLSERDPNSPSKTVSTAPAPSGHPHSNSRSRDDYSNDITDLLAKTKRTQPALNEAPEGGRKRSTNRILGRVTSNLSTTSTTHSRATSVDSTATHGNPVQYSTVAKDNQIDAFLNGLHATGEDQPPPATQLQYEDPDSDEIKERILARMKGEALPRPSRIKERAVTIAMGHTAGHETRARATRMGRGVR